jgi:pimeloyl-ACP methyl ester carboxylesterase
MKAVIYFGISAIALYVAVCALLYLLQGRLLYIRAPEVDRPGAASFRLRSGAASVKVWVLHGSLKPAVIYFGGNADEVSANLPDLDAAFPERAVHLVCYRGYGGSTGEPSEPALIADAEAVYDWAAKRHEGIVVIGRSLGSGVATALAASRPVERLILITPFDSMTHVVEDHFPWLPVRWLLRDSYDSVHRIRTVEAPVLVLVAEHDGVVSRARSDALSAAIAPSLRHTVLIKGATHDDIGRFPSYRQSIKEFAAAH